MKKCFTCGRPIENVYTLDGKIYGYECYKMAVALKYAHMQEMKNEDYARKCAAAIEVFSNKTFKDTWNKDFQTSILNQWNECKKLTGKQLDLITKKFTDIEDVEYYLIYTDISRQFEHVKGIADRINQIHNEVLKVFKNDLRLHELVKEYHASAIKRGNKKYYIVEYKDIDDKESLCAILEQNTYEGIKEDEFYEIIEAIEI